MTTIRTALGLIVLSIMAAACGTIAQPVHEVTPDGAAQAVAFDEELYERGVQVYLNSYCGTCHQLDAAGTWGNFGPSHNGAATLAAARLQDPNYAGDATTTEEYLHESIVNPLVYFTPTYAGSAHRMPAYTNLTEDELDALVYVLLQEE